jgi:transcription initiation factor IIF auxiliary subunit
MITDFVIQQSEEYEGDDWWKWAVWLEGREEDLDRIQFVEWRLHPTFPKPVRKSADRRTKFRIDTGGWGVFQIVARVHMQDGEEAKLTHYLKLHYPDGSQNTA